MSHIYQQNSMTPAKIDVGISVNTPISVLFPGRLDKERYS